MRRLSTLIALVILAQFPHPGWANTLPGKIDYTIFARGQKVGQCNITVKETKKAIVLDSQTHIDFTKDVALDITSHTVADPKTFLVREYSVFGTKDNKPIDAHFVVVGDSIHGTILRGDQEQSDYLKSPYDQTLFLEDFVMDHEVLIALAQVAAGEPRTYGLFFPVAMAINSARVSFASKVEIESDTEGVVCDKLLVGLDGGTNWASYYDPQRKLPVYMAFPATNVEVFLDDFFGDSPISRYREHKSPKAQ